MQQETVRLWDLVDGCIDIAISCLNIEAAEELAEHAARLLHDRCFFTEARLLRSAVRRAADATDPNLHLNAYLAARRAHLSVQLRGWRDDNRPGARS